MQNRNDLLAQSVLPGLWSRLTGPLSISCFPHNHTSTFSNCVRTPFYRDTKAAKGTALQRYEKMFHVVYGSRITRSSFLGDYPSDLVRGVHHEAQWAQSSFSGKGSLRRTHQ
jgi:hypothetical protein